MDRSTWLRRWMWCPFTNPHTPTPASTPACCDPFTGPDGEKVKADGGVFLSHRSEHENELSFVSYSFFSLLFSPLLFKTHYSWGVSGGSTCVGGWWQDEEDEEEEEDDDDDEDEDDEDDSNC